MVLKSRVGAVGSISPPFEVPMFVLSHDIPEKLARGKTTFTFVTEGIESALEQAQEVAGDKVVGILGGANVAQQYIKAGIVDDIQIHLIPVLLAEGTRLFEHIGT